VHVLEEGYPLRMELCSRIDLEEVLVTYLAWTDAGTLGPLCFRVMASAPSPTASAAAAIARPYVASEYCIGSGWVCTLKLLEDAPESIEFPDHVAEIFQAPAESTVLVSVKYPVLSVLTV